MGLVLVALLMLIVALLMLIVNYMGDLIADNGYNLKIIRRIFG